MTRIPTRTAGAIALLLTTTVQADVTLEERVSVTGAGLMKMANMSGTTRTIIAADRARTESNLQFESGMMRTLARGAGQSTEIVRLDQDKVYALDPSEKTYTETTLAELRAQLGKAMDQAGQAQATQIGTASGVDDSQCEWSDPKADVQRTGEKASIAGHQAERVTVTATQACKDKATGQVCDFGLVLDQWLTPNFEAADETLAYQRAYAEKLGFDASASRDFAERAEAMFGRYQGIWKEVAAKMRDVEGYPVKASFGLGVGGPQCKSIQEAQASAPPSAPDVSSAVGASVGSSVGSSVGNSVSNSVGSSVGGTLGGALGGALGGVFGRKKEPAQPAAAAPPPAPPGGLMPLMTVSTELVSVNRAPASPQSFEVPGDFKKK